MPYSDTCQGQETDGPALSPFPSLWQEGSVQTVQIYAWFCPCWTTVPVSGTHIKLPRSNNWMQYSDSKAPLSMCADQDRFEVTVIPRYLIE